MPAVISTLLMVIQLTQRIKKRQLPEIVVCKGGFLNKNNRT
jgi:hypothetical protein